MKEQINVLGSAKYTHNILPNPQGFLRGLSEPHGVVAFAHDLFASAVHELSEPADAAYEEAGVDIEKDHSRVAVGIFPVGKKGRLWRRERMRHRVSHFLYRLYIPGREEAGANPDRLRAQGGVEPGQGAKPPQGLTQKNALRFRKAS